jgi:phosphoribosyl 1,2-cyclic phosphodiesterase
VTHDAGPTFGFRFEATGDLFQPGPAIGYVADLGNWTQPLVEALRDVDMLAVEFNHDVEMEATSGRRAVLIARVLGDEGHLSNDQGAALVRAVIQASQRPLRHLVLLHLSHQCNRPALARAVAEEALAEVSCEAEIHVASQDEASPCLDLAMTERTARTRSRSAKTRTPSTWTQKLLPGLEEG